MDLSNARILAPQLLHRYFRQTMLIRNAGSAVMKCTGRVAGRYSLMNYSVKGVSD